MQASLEVANHSSVALPLYHPMHVPRHFLRAGLYQHDASSCSLPAFNSAVKYTASCQLVD